MGPGRGCHCGDRPGRDPGDDHRTEAALRHPAVMGMPGHGLRYLPAPLLATLGDAASGGRDPGTGGDDRDVFPGPDLHGAAGYGRGLLRAAAEPAPGVIVRGGRDPGCHGHAPQSVSAFGPRPDSPDRERPEEQGHGLPLLSHRLDDRPQSGVLRQRGHLDRERGGLPPSWCARRQHREGI